MNLYILFHENIFEFSPCGRILISGVFCMADLTNNIRLAVDSGKTAIGLNSVIDSIRDSTAKLVIVASKNKESNLQDILHMASVAGIKVIKFEGNPVELGSMCGKPYSISMLSVIDAGHSSILKD